MHLGSKLTHVSKRAQKHINRKWNSHKNAQHIGVHKLWVGKSVHKTIASNSKCMRIVDIMVVDKTLISFAWPTKYCQLRYLP